MRSMGTIIFVICTLTIVTAYGLEANTNNDRAQITLSGAIMNDLPCLKTGFPGFTPQNIIERYKNNTLQSFLNTVYNSAITTIECFKDPDDEYKSRLTPEAMSYVENRKQVYSEMVKYIFGDNGTRTIELVKDGSLSCYLDKVDKRQTVYNSHTSLCKYFEKEELFLLNRVKELCPNAYTYLSYLRHIIYSGFCGHEDKKNGVSPISVNEASVNVVFSNVPRRGRMIRELGGTNIHMDAIEKKIKKTCANSKEVEKAIDAMKTCVKEKTMFVTPRDEYIAHIDYCSIKTREELKKCLPTKLQYFPDFFFNLVESMVRFLYDDIEAIAIGLGPCVSKLKDEESQEDYQNCIAAIISKHEDDIPNSKKEFCERFIPISSCFVKQVNDTCTTNPELEKFNRDYMTAVERPCK